MFSQTQNDLVCHSMGQSATPWDTLSLPGTVHFLVLEPSGVLYTLGPSGLVLFRELGSAPKALESQKSQAPWSLLKSDDLNNIFKLLKEAPRPSGESVDLSIALTQIFII